MKRSDLDDGLRPQGIDQTIERCATAIAHHRVFRVVSKICRSAFERVGPWQRIHPAPIDARAAKLSSNWRQWFHNCFAQLSVRTLMLEPSRYRFPPKRPPGDVRAETSCGNGRGYGCASLHRHLQQHASGRAAAHQIERRVDLVERELVRDQAIETDLAGLR